MPKSKIKVGLIGCGNLVTAIFEGFYQKNKNSNYEFYCYTPSGTRAEKLARQIGGSWVQKLEDLPSLDICVLGFKPQQLEEASVGLAKLLPNHCVVMSLLAAVSIDNLVKRLKLNSIIRIMPNIASLYGAGATTYFIPSELHHQPLEKIVQDLFSAISKVFKVFSEDEMNIITAVNASGPALVFIYAQAMIKWLEGKNISRELSSQIVNQTFLGSSMMMNNEDRDITELKRQVSSAKGITIEGLNYLEAQNFSSTVEASLDKIYSRNIELSK